MCNMPDGLVLPEWQVPVGSIIAVETDAEAGSFPSAAPYLDTRRTPGPRAEETPVAAEPQPEGVRAATTAVTSVLSSGVAMAASTIVPSKNTISVVLQISKGVAALSCGIRVVAVIAIAASAWTSFMVKTPLVSITSVQKLVHLYR